MSTSQDVTLPPISVNLARLRRQRGLTLRQLARRLAEIGQPINVDGVNRIEMGKRQVTTPELLALAVTLNVSPMTLLMPAEPGDVQLTPAVVVEWERAWRWAVGDQPLVREGEPPLTWDDPRWEQFIKENRPYEASPVKELSAFLLKRFWPMPWSVDLRHEGNAKVKGGIRITNEADDDARQL